MFIGSWVLGLGALTCIYLDLGFCILEFPRELAEQRYAVQECDATKAPAPDSYRDQGWDHNLLTLLRNMKLNSKYYAFLLMQFKSLNAISKRLIKVSSPLRSHTRGS
jgi:hypothetical protein